MQRNTAGWLAATTLLAWTALTAGAAPSDHCLGEFPRRAGETDDAPRFQRAVDACRGGGVLSVAGGDYTFAQTVFVTNLCSIEMSPGATIVATAPMEWMIKIDQRWQFAPRFAPKDVNAERYNLTFRGGTLDARGFGSCLAIDNYRHFTLENATFLNGKRYGVAIETMGRGYEMIARNLYFKTLMPGLAGNVGLCSHGGDSHYTDIVCVDYTVGVHFARRGANVLTRIHVWGGPVKPAKKGELPEMLKKSVCFRIDSSGEILRDCYADTGEIGYWINGWENRMVGCRYFNNVSFNLKDVTIIRQDRGWLHVDDCRFVKNTPTTKILSASADAKTCWGKGNVFQHFGADDSIPKPSDDLMLQPVDIDLGRQLFLDDKLLEKNTAKRVWHKPVKSPLNPVLKPETPLERGGPQKRNACAVPYYGGIWYDGQDKTYKCWYNAGWSDGLAYATSKDGITWERPALQADGGNLVFTCPAQADSESIVIDPDALDGQRFKCFLYIANKNGHGTVRTSADGIHWSEPTRTAALGDSSTIFYNPFSRLWGYSIRAWGGKDYGRARELSLSDNFVLGARDFPYREKWLRDAVGGKAKTGEQFYNFDCVAYEGVMIGLGMIMKGEENGYWGKLNIPKHTDLRFCFSHDCRKWTFPKMTAGGDFIEGTRKYGDWDMGYVRSNSGVCLVMGDELRFYYGAFAGDKEHGNGRDDVYHGGMYANAATGFATLRRDGFCSLEEGTVTTKPLLFTKGDRLWVNVDAHVGTCVVRVEDAKGKSLGEKTLAGVNSTRLDVGALTPRTPFRLTFVCSGGARLYSFWTSDAKGRSGGYLAGGSPESATLRDE